MGVDDRITTNPRMMGGQATIRGMRLTVSPIVGLMAAGHSDESILGLYPYLEAADLVAVREWWASPEGMRWALARLHGGTTRTVIAMVQRLLSGESIEDVARDYNIDGEPIDPDDLAEDLGEIPRLLAARKENP